MRDVGVVRDVGFMRGAVAALMRHIVVNGKEAARAFPIKRKNHRRAAHLPSAPLPISEPTFLSSSSGKRFEALTPARRRRPPFLLIPRPLPATMAPKTSKGKGAAKDAKSEAKRS